MSYTLYKTNGTLLTTVNDGSLDTTTDLTFVGKNYSGYGPTLNQDLVSLLENFAGKVAPSKPITGELWYDSGTSKLRVYNSTRFKPVATIDSGNTYPTDLSQGDLFWNISEQKLYLYTGSGYIAIGPQQSGLAATNTVQYANVYDTSNYTHNILEHNVQNRAGTLLATAISNSDSDFTLNGINAIPGYTKVYQGITFYGANQTNGVTRTSTTGSGYILWGTAAHALAFGPNANIAADFVLKASPIMTEQLQINSDSGLVIQSSNSGQTLIKNSGDDTQIINQIGGLISVKGLSGGSITDILNFNPEALQVLPTQTPGLTTDIGSNIKPFANVWATNSRSVNSYSTSSYVQNLLPFFGSTTGFANTIGSAIDPFDTVYATNIVTSSLESETMKLPVYATNTARDAAITIPQAGMLVFVTSGSHFQGYNGSAWVNIT